MYDFDNVPSRFGTGSLKWDECAPGELPMWVADMDFPAAPEIRAALEERAAHGVFGYNILPEAWAQAYIRWWRERHGFEMRPEWLIFCAGVVPAISTCVRKLTTPAEKVLIETPVYNIFFNSILNNGRVPLEVPLLRDGDGLYHRDFAALERAMADPQASLMILCNPHNPVGRIWPREELARIGQLAQQYGVTVISDEIHCDLTDPGVSYVPFASVSDICRAVSVTCMAPTKAFNIAGIQTAAVCVPEPRLRHKVWRGLNTDEVAEPNTFAVPAAIAAFEKGGPWLDELREYIYRNKGFTLEALKAVAPQIAVTPSQATYLLWLDCSRAAEDTDALCDFIRAETGLVLSPGGQFGGDGHQFIRLNLAAPRARLADGLDRFAHGLSLWRKK